MKLKSLLLKIYKPN